MLSPVRIDAPAVTPVSLDEAKAHLEVTDDYQDAMIEGFIAAATELLDGPNGKLGRALITQTWRVPLETWCFPIRLPFGPVQEIVSIGYSNSANVDAVFSPSGYALHGDYLGAAVHLNTNVSTPSVYTRVDAVRVTFKAGYGDNPSDVPAPIRQAILLMVGSMHANREDVVIGATVEALAGEATVKALLAPYRIFA